MVEERLDNVLSSGRDNIAGRPADAQPRLDSGEPVFDDLVHDLEARRRGMGGDVPGDQRLSGFFVDQEDAADGRFGSLEPLQDKLGDLQVADVFHTQVNEVIGRAALSTAPEIGT